MKAVKHTPPPGCMFYRHKMDLFMHGPDGWQQFDHYTQKWRDKNPVNIPAEVLHLAAETIKADRQS